nr:BON domain-containing protein [Pseudobdellovibrionaceae bacterium]
MKYLILSLSIFLQFIDQPRVFAQIAPPTMSNEPKEISALEATYSDFKEQTYVDLTLGIDHIETLPDLPERISFGGDFKKIVGAEYSKANNNILLKPRKEGFATLTIQDPRTSRILKKYRITVKKSDLDKVARELRALIGDIEGINIKIVNNKVLVDGQVIMPQDISRIHSSVQQFGDKATTIATLSPIALKKIAEVISRDVNNPEIEVRAINGTIVLTGWAASEDEKKDAELKAKLFMPPIVLDPNNEKAILQSKRANDGVVNLIKIKEGAPPPAAKIVQIVVHFVELNKDYNKAFKIGWIPSMDDASNLQFSSGGSSGSGVVSSITGIVKDLLPKLNFAKDHGHARILKSSSILVESGKKGVISQMTDYPVTSIGKDGQPITSTIGVGINTGIIPKVSNDKSGSVSMEIDFSLGSLLGLSKDGAPIKSENKVQTTLTIRDRQSAAIGGLITNSTNSG